MATPSFEGPFGSFTQQTHHDWSKLRLKTIVGNSVFYSVSQNGDLCVGFTSNDTLTSRPLSLLGGVPMRKGLCDSTVFSKKGGSLKTVEGVYDFYERSGENFKFGKRKFYNQNV